MNVDSVLQTLHRACEAAGGINQWSAANGLTDTYVRYVLARKQKPAGKLLNALGLEKVVDYRKKGK